MFARFLTLKRDGGAAVKTTAPKIKGRSVPTFYFITAFIILFISLISFCTLN